MVVIAIIIILAAIAIPNYLKMTERAKRSRLASDMSTLATVLETFKTDWGIYPKDASAEAINSASSLFRVELSQGGSGTAVTNKAGQYNAVGEQGPVNYIKDGTLTSITDPFNSSWSVMYVSTASGTAGWVIYAQTDTAKFLYRTSSMSTVSESSTSAITVPSS